MIVEDSIEHDNSPNEYSITENEISQNDFAPRRSSRIKKVPKKV